MNEYTNGKGWWTEHKGIRVEVYHNGTWAVYTLKPLPFHCIASADKGRGKDMDEARILAREAFKEVRALLQRRMCWGRGYDERTSIAGGRAFQKA